MERHGESGTPSIGIPPLAGICTYDEAAKIGWSVDENVDLLRRYSYVKKRLVDLSAAFMNPTVEWEVKCALSHHLWLDAQHAAAIRDRVAELRKPPLFLDRVPDGKLESLLDEAFRSQSTLELLVAVFWVIRPALFNAYQRHLRGANPLFDYPTCRILRQAAADEWEIMAWGEQAIAALIDSADARENAKAWEDHLRAYLDHAGGIDGLLCVALPVELPTPRAVGPFEPSFEPKRDWRSGDIHNFSYRPNDVYLDTGASFEERNLALMYKRFHEMDVPEMMASIVYETSGKPWQYTAEMTRQIWDECRHSMMGEVWFAKNGVDWSKYPNHVGWCTHLNLDLTPLERHIVLFFIEQNLMDGQIGKKLEWEIARASGDPFTAFLQDYDWADEVLHAQIGRRWLKPDVGDVKTLLERGREIAERSKPSIGALLEPSRQIDWWPEFVRDVLGVESTSQVGEHRLIPSFVSRSDASDSSL